MILPCEILQPDMRDVGRNDILQFFLVAVRKIISVQEIYSDSLFGTDISQWKKYVIGMCYAFLYLLNPVFHFWAVRYNFSGIDR